VSTVAIAGSVAPAKLRRQDARRFSLAWELPVAIAKVAASAPARRLAAVDALRGLAILAMVVYHFSWDLWAFGLTTADVAFGLGWRLFAHSIATTFLTLVGVGLVLATRNGFKPQPFFRRLGLIAAGSLAVSIATWVTDPSTFVFFGILHLIAVATALGILFVALPIWVTALAAVAVIAVGNVYASPAFNAAWLVWTGLATQVPDTVDYYPLFPWFGVVLIGVALGRLFVGSPVEAALADWQPADPVTRCLALAGRWSLWIYLTHQLILYGGVALAASILSRRGPASESPTGASTDPAQSYMSECLSVCGAQGRSVQFCTTYCGCMVAGLAGTDILAISPDKISDAQRGQPSALSNRCAATAPTN
jgi:uncharacterized membrane protein